MEKFLEEAGSGPKAWLYAVIAAAAVAVIWLLWWALGDRKRKEKRWTRMDEDELEKFLLDAVSEEREELAIRIGERPNPNRNPEAYRQYLRKLQDYVDGVRGYGYSMLYGPRPDPDRDPKAYRDYLRGKYVRTPQGSRQEEDDFEFSCAMPSAPADHKEQIRRTEKEWEESARTDRIRFSALTNRTAEKGNWLLIDLYAYEDACRHLVDEALARAEEPQQEKQSGYQQVREGQKISVNLRSPDIGFDEQQEMPWAGGFLDFSFAAEIPEDYAKKQILFTASVSLDGIPVTKLNFIAAVKGEKAQAEIERKDIRSAFVSYASMDREAVTMLIMGMKKVNPKMDLFFDVENISTGSYWEDVLKKEILDRDILFLCWSRNASASEWVDREWRYAYEQKGIDAVEPLPLEPPENCPPPEELQQKHFNNILLYVTGSRKQQAEDGWMLTDMLTGKSWLLDGRQLTAGRGEDCDIRVTGDQTVSRVHCCLSREGNRVVLECKGTNGLLLFRDQELCRVRAGETVTLEQPYYLRLGKADLFRVCMGKE